MTNEIIKLKENNKKKENPYQDVNKLQFQLFELSGRLSTSSINTKFFDDSKALFILFDLTNEESFKRINNYINLSLKSFEICKKNKIKNKEKEKDNIIKQPEFFNDIPILVIGNKSDLIEKRKILFVKIKQFIENIKNENNFKNITYHEISVKEDKGIEKIFQETIFYYLKRNFISNKQKNHDEGSLSHKQSQKLLSNIDKIDNSNNIIFNKNNNSSKNVIDKKIDKILDIKEERKERKKPIMDKNMVILYQMLDKVKKQYYNEIISLKEENKKEIDKITKDFDNKMNILNKKINKIENKNKELENQIKIKNEEIDNLKVQIENNNLNKDISLKFKIPDEKFENEIMINSKGEKRLSEVINDLYELCPYLFNLKVKYFCLEGYENKKIDEMKTVNENNLSNGSVIHLIVQ